MDKQSQITHHLHKANSSRLHSKFIPYHCSAKAPLGALAERYPCKNEEITMENQTLENRYTATEQMLTEYFAKLRPAFSKVMYGCLLVVQMLLLILQILLRTWQYDLSLFALPLLCIVILGIGFFGLPVLQAKHALMQRKTIHGGDAAETIAVFGDTIALTEGTHRSEYRYEQIQKVVCLKHSYALMLSNRIGVLVASDGFQNGTAEAFLRLLRENNPKLTIQQ